MSRTRGGFTLVELMVALTVGGIAISSLYAVGSASTRNFREQSRVSTTQSSLRAAMNQIKRDFQRAGYLGTPNVAMQSERCVAVTDPINDTSGKPGTGRLAAISAFHDNVARPAALDPANLNSWATVDEVILTGNYSTSGEYMGVQMDPNEQNLTISMTTQSFRRDFMRWYTTPSGAAGTCDAAALQTAFAVDRLVRLHTLSELNAYAQVESATCDAVSAGIRLKTRVSSPCNATSGWISPLNTIRYHVADATDPETTRTGDNRVAVLRRTEVNPADKARTLMIRIDDDNERPADDRAVLDYVVKFDVQFLIRRANPNTLDWVAATRDEVFNNPERVRGVIIELAARTAEHEPGIDARDMPKTLRVPPFRVFNTHGAARTRSLRAELFLPNIAYEGF